MTHGRFDLYVEAEYVHDSHDNSSSYLYSWNELGFKPVDWLRLGIAGQRTRIYGGERNIQRGPFADFTIGKFRIAATKAVQSPTVRRNGVGEAMTGGRKTVWGISGKPKWIPPAG